MKNMLVSGLLATAALFAPNLFAEDKPATPAPVPAAAKDEPKAAAPAAAKTETKAEPGKAVTVSPVAPVTPKIRIAPPPYAAFSSMVQNADANADGIIDDQEADAAIKALSDTIRQQFKYRNAAVLKKYDLDQDGRLSPEEVVKMKEYLRDLQLKARRPVTKPQIQAMSPPNGRIQPVPAAPGAPLMLEKKADVKKVEEKKPEPAPAK